MAIRLMEAAMDWVPLCMALIRDEQNGCRGQVMIPSAGSPFWPQGDTWGGLAASIGCPLTSRPSALYFFPSRDFRDFDLGWIGLFFEGRCLVIEKE